MTRPRRAAKPRRARSNRLWDAVWAGADQTERALHVVVAGTILWLVYAVLGTMP